MAEFDGSMPTELHDAWILDGNSVKNGGDADLIDALLSQDLVTVAAKEGGWRQLYRHVRTGALWELSYPQGGLHGGGPRSLRQLSLTAEERWL